MKITIRADASTKMGSGHVMRCLTLAELLREKGFSVTFITRKYDGNLNGFISKKGFHVLELNKTEKSKIDKIENLNISDDYKEWLGVSESLDAEDTIYAIGDEKLDWLIVDHYSLSEKWEKTIRPFVKNIMVIDDLANRFHDCDLLLDQNWFENLETRYNDLVPANCTTLLGPKYALLRSEFSEIRKTLKPLNEIVKKIFIFFGASDPYNLTEMAIQCVSEQEMTYIEIDVVIGENNIHRDRIQKLAELRGRTHLHIQIDNMAAIMKKADLAIGSGGATTWERMCLNLESHVIITADNQKEVTENLNNNKYISLIGYADSMNLNKFRKHIKERILRKSFVCGSENFISLCDGYGTNRVVKEMKLILEDSPEKSFINV